MNSTLYLGGTRSGKSALAEAQARQAAGPVLYVATAESRPDDPNMCERIRRHRARRPASWRTVECPLHLAEGIATALLNIPELSPEQISVSRRADAPGQASHSADSSSVNTQSGNQTDIPVQPTILLDCVTLWITNILFNLPDQTDIIAFETAITREVNALLDLMEHTDCNWILVSGETGLGGIAPDALTRTFCDGLGLANQLLAARANAVYLVVAGCRLALKDASGLQK